ncbi:MAG: hypothetical protein ACYDEY_16390 [Acidimicrobiales bacterium]
MSAPLAATAASQWRLTSTEVSAGAAVLIALVSITTFIVTNATTNQRDRRKLLLELRRQSKDELYAPLIVLLDQDQLYHDRLVQDKGEDWHILDHVEEVLANELDLAGASGLAL